MAGDGAKWIDECVAEFFPEATRCVDFFHVCGWANDALDDVRLSICARAKAEHDRLKKAFAKEEAEERRAREEAERELERARAELDAMPRRGRPSKRKLQLRAYVEKLEEALAADGGGPAPKPGKRGRKKKEPEPGPEHQAVIDELEEKRKAIKGMKHALGHAPENRTANQDQMIALIEVEQPDLWQAFQLKERLRLILHMRDAEEAAAQLDEWIEDASSCGIAAMEKLSEKVGKHRENILNAIRLQANSAKSEACNTTIKALIKMARGFRNLDNMFALIYLKCSDIVIPLHNRPQPSADHQKKARDAANLRRRAREEERRMHALSA